MSKKRSSLEAFGFQVKSKVQTPDPEPLDEISQDDNNSLSDSSANDELLSSLDSTAEDIAEENEQPQPSTSAIQEQPSAIGDYQMQALLCPSELPASMKFSTLSNRDIGLAVGKTLNDIEKFEFLTKLFVPPKNYKFYPVMQAKRKRFPQKHWFDHKWLTFSHVEHGYFCRACVLFHRVGINFAGGGNKYGTEKFTMKPFRKFKDLMECWTKEHVCSKNHQWAESQALAFLQSQSSDKVAKQVDKNYKAEIEKNRCQLKAVFKALNMVGRYDLPSRGHIDHGKFSLDDTCKNDGVFRAILRLMGQAGDPGVQAIVNAKKHASYLSPEIQNEVFGCMAQLVTKKVVADINAAGMFTLMADETSSATREFVTIVIRYVKPDFSINEAFLQFKELIGTTGKEVADSLIEALMQHGINIKQMVGQGYDGASNMSSGGKGVHGRIKELVPTAEYFWCAAHRLNLVATDAAADVSIAQMLSCIREIINYFNASVKRSAVLKQQIENLIPAANKQKLTALCPTRWVERHDALLSFKELLLAIIAALQSLKETESDYLPSALLGSISNFQSVFTLVLTCDVANELKAVSKYLQRENCDLLSAHAEIVNATESLSKRTYQAASFFTLYNESKRLAEDLGIPEELPRSAARCSDTSIQQYYYTNVFCTYLKRIVSELERRFADTQRMAFHIQKLLPTFIIQNETDNFDSMHFKQMLEFYAPFLNGENFTAFSGETRRWKTKWTSIDEDSLPQTVSETLKNVGPAGIECYPTITMLLKILLTLPVSTATPERTFSTLGRIFSERRRTMSTERLSNLATLSFHFEEAAKIDLDDAVTLFAASNRRLKLM